MKKTLSVALAIVLAVGAVAAQQVLPASPRGTAAIQVGGKWVESTTGGEPVLAAALSGISTQPNPRDWPVSRLVMRLIFATAPYDSKSWRRS